MMKFGFEAGWLAVAGVMLAGCGDDDAPAPQQDVATMDAART
jgi:hypothetical protein